MKHILFLLMLMITGLNAEDFTFIVENGVMVDAYWNIFNSMAALFQNTEYNSLLQLAFLVGGFGVFFAGVLKGMGGGNGQGSIMDFTKYMVVGMSLLTLVYSHTSNMVIKTNTIPSFCSASLPANVSQVSSSPTTGVIVGNIPTMLAWAFSGLNTIGVESTRMAKLAFQPLTNAGPADPNARSGFADYLAGIGAITSLSLDTLSGDTALAQGTSTIGSTLVGITNDCLLIPAAQDPIYGTQIISALQQTGNLALTMDALIMHGEIITYKNPTIISGNTIATGVTIGGIQPDILLVNTGGTMTSCGEAWGQLYLRLKSLKNSGALECTDSLKDVLTPSTIGILTGDAGLGTVPMARDISLNAAMANQVFDAKRNLAIGSEVSFAAGKSMSEFTTNSLGSGYYMAQMLPYLQMGIRAVLYAFFPFVFVVILLPGGIKVLISYLQSLVWVELWTPTAAILDMFMGLVSTEKFANMYNQKGFNPTNSVQTFSDAAMLASVAGYLYASVPALTYLILKGSAQMLGNITSGVAAGMSKNLDSATINRDIGALKGRQAVNNDRISNGEKMVSLAEMDSMAAGHLASSTAGNWLTNEEHKNSLVKAGKGESLAKIMSGTATQDVYGGNKQAQQSYAVNAKQDQLNTLMKQISTGTAGGDKAAMLAQATTLGQKFNQDYQDEMAKQKALGTDTNSPEKVAAIAGIRATESAKALLLDEASQKALGIDAASDKDGKKMEEYVNVKTTESMTKYQSEKKTQELFGSPNQAIEQISDANSGKVLKSVNEFNSEVAQQMKQNPGMSRGEAIVKAAHNIGTMNGLKEQEIQTRLQAFAGEDGKMVNGVLTFSDKGNKNLVDTVNRNENVAAQTAVGTGNTNATDAEIRNAAKINEDTMVAEKNAIPKLNENTMKAAVAMGDKESAALEHELARKKNGKAVYSEADKNMKRAAFIKSNLGVLGKVANQVGGSAEAKENLRLGLNATKKGQYAARILQGTINGGADIGQELMGSANGKQYMDQAQKDLKLKGNYNDLTREQQAAVSAQAIQTIGNTNKALKASVDHYVATNLNKDYRNNPGGASGALSDSEVTTKEATAAKNALLKSVLQSNANVGTLGAVTTLASSGQAVTKVLKQSKTVIKGTKTAVTKGVDKVAPVVNNLKDKALKHTPPVIKNFIVAKNMNQAIK